MKIEKYEFGSMIIKGKEYYFDVKIFPEEIKPKWYREQGHRIAIEDLQDAIQFPNYDYIIIGTGAYGVAQVEDDVIQKIPKEKLLIFKTHKAVEEFNRLTSENLIVIGCFHLTC